MPKSVMCSVTRMNPQSCSGTEGPGSIEKEGLCSIAEGGGLPSAVMFDASRP